jgi:hypothetical protein
MPSSGFSIGQPDITKPVYFQRAIGSDTFEKIFGYLPSMSNSARAKGNQVQKGWKK